MKKSALLVLSALVITGLAGCAGPADIHSKPQDTSSSEITSSEESSTEEVKEIEVKINDVTSTNLEIGEEITLTTTVLNNVDNLPVVWSSSDATVASIDANGKVKALKVGTTNITAKVGTIVSAKVTFTVKAKPVLAESVSISSEKAVVGVGEEITITATVLPETTTNKAVTLSTDSIKVQIDGMKIKGLTLTDDEEEVTITATTSNGKTDTLKLKVVSLYDSVMPGVKTRVEGSKEIEKTALKTAKYEFKQTEADGSVASTSTEDFEIFNDNSAMSIAHKNNEYTETLYSVDGDSLLHLVKTGKTMETLTYDSSSKIKPITENGGWGKVTASEAAAYTSLICIGNSSIEDFGVAGYTLKNFINLYNGFANSEAKALFTYKEINANKFEMTSYFNYSSSFLDIKLTVEFFESGLIKSSVYESKEYDYDYDTEKAGSLLKTKTYTITVAEGERTAGTGKTLKKSDLYFTDITLGTSSTDPSWKGITEAVEFEVGDTVYLYAKNGQPSTASDLFDTIEIVSVSDSDALTLPRWGAKTKATCNKAIDDVVITAKTTGSNITKDVHIKITAPVVTDMNITGLVDTDFDITTREFTVKPTPSNAILDLTVTIDEATNTAGAVVSKVDDGKYSITCQKEGAYTVKVVDKTLGEAKAYSKTVTVLKASEESIAAYIAGGNYSIDNKSSNKITDFNITHVAGTNGGEISFTCQNTAIKSNYKIVKGTDGKYNISVNPIKVDDFSEWTFNFYGKANQRFEKIQFSFYYGLDDSNTYVNVTIK